MKMGSRYLSLRFATTVLLLSGTILLGELTSRRISDSLAVPLDQIDTEIAGWKHVSDNTLAASVLKQLDPTSYLSRTYKKGTTDLDLFIAYYAQQRAGESMHSPKHCLPGSGWEIWKHGSAIVPVNQQKIEINKYSVQNHGTRMLMSYWYQSKTRAFSSEYMGKMLLAKDTLLTGHTAGSIVRIIVPDTPGAEQESIEFAARLIPLVARSFGSERPLNTE
jgi:EpsI family protein